MILFRKKGSIRNIQGERYARLTIPGRLTKLVQLKNGNWMQMYKRNIRKWR